MNKKQIYIKKAKSYNFYMLVDPKKDKNRLIYVN